METKSFFIVENGKQSGPFSLEDLKLKNIEYDTLVWFEGQENWGKVKDIPEVSLLIKKMPPPIDKIDDGQNSKIPPVPNSSVDILNDFELASFGQRFGAYFLTKVIIIIFFFVFDSTSSDIESSNSFWLDIMYAGVFSGVFNGFFYPFFAGNLGHKLLGIMVVSKKDNSPLNNFFLGYTREFLKEALSVLVVPVIWLFFDKEKQNLYDKIQDTIVVKVKT